MKAQPSSIMDNTQWQTKETNVAKAIAAIPKGSYIYIGNGAATPHLLVNHMMHVRNALEDNEILQFFPQGVLPFADKMGDRFRLNAFFADDCIMPKLNQQVGDYTPSCLSELHRLIENKLINVDVALIKVTPPDKNGICSLGIGVDITKHMVEHANIVIAEVAPQMPWTYGDSLVSVDDIDHWVENDIALDQKQILPLDLPEIELIGKYLSSLIEDGDTIQIGGEAARTVFSHLLSHKNLGVHTELMTDGVMHLIEKGVITNEAKPINRGISVFSHAFGSQRLYDFIDQNPDIELHPFSYTNNWVNIAKLKNIVAIQEVQEIDLTGQVSAVTSGDDQHGGFWGLSDFIRGASLAENGSPVVALLSTRLPTVCGTSSEEPTRKSSIVPTLKQGSGIVLTRSDIHYAVTEFGVANLRGKSIRERALALIDIAHPDFRVSLLEAAKQLNYISPKQQGLSLTTAYPKEWEFSHTTRQGKTLFIRPIKAIDEDALRDFFHQQSNDSVYLRYFSHLNSLPQKVLKSASDIDYTQDMAFVALHTTSGNSQEIVAIAQYFSNAYDDAPEIAIQVRDDWQGHGLGKFMFHQLVKVARCRQFTSMKADTLRGNQGMNHVFSTAGYPFERKSEFGVYTYTFEI